MIRFNNDYNLGCHPAVLEALKDNNSTAFPGYGTDKLCEKAADEIKKYMPKADCSIHFLTGGTQVNSVLIEAALRPYQSVICPESAHINVHESGAVESTGHKIQALKAENGKITASQIEEEMELYLSSDIPEHITQPRLVYISFPTEYGTLYSKKELEAISASCAQYGLYLYIDGARMGYGLGSEENDLSLSDLCRLSSAFTIGGTKCGALFGEALAINSRALDTDFRNYMKMSGALLAKGWLLGLQFDALFKDGLYFEITKKADEYAQMIKRAFEEKGFSFYMDSPTNQQFVIVNKEQMNKLAQKYYFEYEANLKDGNHCIRFCTSWGTKEEDVQTLIKDIETL